MPDLSIVSCIALFFYDQFRVQSFSGRSGPLLCVQFHAFAMEGSYETNSCLNFLSLLYQFLLLLLLLRIPSSASLLSVIASILNVDYCSDRKQM